MKGLIVLASALLVLSSFGPKSEVQRMQYRVFLDGRAIGTYDVNRTDLNGSSHFRVETNMAVGLIRKSEHRFSLLSSFNDSKLLSSNLKTWVNQKLETSSDLRWNGEQYVKQDGENLTDICTDLVSYSSACVYFVEPVNRTSLFYEKYGKDLTLFKLEDHKYEVKLPNGTFERYTYKDGLVSKVEFVQSFTTITLEAVN